MSNMDELTAEIPELEFHDGPVVRTYDIRADLEVTREECAERVSYMNYTIVGQAQPTPVLQRNPLRKRAVIFVSTLTNSPGLIWGYDPSAIQNGAGFKVTGNNQSIELKNQRPLYLYAAGVAASSATVSIMEEWYEQSRDEIE